MALQNVIYQSMEYLNIPPCSTITVCLTPTWTARVVGGTNKVTGTLLNRYRDLAGIINFGSYDPRGSKRMQYELLIENAQFVTNPSTGLPWVPTCDDVLSVTACI